jgi:DNA-binding PadR family transcriptional regulator
MEFHDLLAGFVRIHILHHAAGAEVYGQWLIEDLARHGYRISPGTLYPMLQAMEERGYLTSREDSDGRPGRRRKVYTATEQGRRVVTSGIIKDVVMLGGHQDAEIDFVADNPGMTLFHCHQQLHMDFGFMALFDYDKPG